jgi:hypothetical protein
LYGAHRPEACATAFQPVRIEAPEVCRGVGRRILVIAAALAVSGGCAAPSPLPPPPPPASMYSEEHLRPAGPLQVEIVDLRETLINDGAEVMLQGMLLNHGPRSTSRLRLTVRALDAEDRVVFTAPATPSTEVIAVNGVVSFTAILVNSPSVQRYHVEAAAR